MSLSVSLVTLLVRDYDEAISFYTSKVGYELVEDKARGPGKRWVVVGPPGGGPGRLLLAKAEKEAQLARVGDQTGGKVFGLMETTDFEASYSR